MKMFPAALPPGRPSAPNGSRRSTETSSV